jgi:N utilization substance protein A
MNLSGVIDAVSKEKNLDSTIVVDALKQAIMHAARRDYGANADLEAEFDEEKEEINLILFRTVVEDGDVADSGIEIALEDARKMDASVDLGDSIGESIDAAKFGRIAAQSAKQIIVQKMREAERMKVFDEFKDRVGEIMSGYVKSSDRSGIVVDLGKVEAVIPYKEQMQGERFRAKDRIQGYVVDVKKSSRGPQIVMSRAHSMYLVKLFEQHVTEIYDGIVTIKSAARDPGLRSKIAVYSRDGSVDPVGACVGMKGSRVQAVVQELNGEKIDIVPWDPDVARLVCNALAPAVVSKVIVDEENHAMEVVVADDQLSLAIGRRGQNVRLAAQLTGWKLDIKSEAKLAEQLAGVKMVLASIEGLGDMQAGVLVNEGIKSPSDLAALSPRQLVRLLNLDDETAEKIITAAQAKAEEYEDALEDGADYRSEDAFALPEDDQKPVERDHLKERVQLFLRLNGVGEAAAAALAEGGYRAIGDVVADTAEEVSDKTGLPIGVAKTIQMAADRYLQSQK